MAASPAVRSAKRSIIALIVILLAMAGIISLGVLNNNATLTPKLALDLQGGTQILLAPKTASGETVSEEQVKQAVSIIRQRVDAAGVSESEISTMGGNNILVSIPGQADEDTLHRIEASARLEFRPVLAVAPGIATPKPKLGADGKPILQDGAQPAEQNTEKTEEQKAEEQKKAEENEAARKQQEEADKAALRLKDGDPALDPQEVPTEAGTTKWISPTLQTKFLAFACTDPSLKEVSNAPQNRPIITCDQHGVQKYILGPVELSGESIADASSGLLTGHGGASTGQWAVNLTLDGPGTQKFGEVSQRMHGAQAPLNQFAFVIDGRVLSAPVMQAAILDGRPQITGGYTQESAKTMADQLKYGALPISFTVQSQEQISATLGVNQLHAGLIAGLIGLALVVVYSLIQYRALGILTVASLAVAAIVTYLALLYLSWRYGYRLSLAGVAGVIVAIGVTADSFIVYFERVRDAVREGHDLISAVELGWKKATRTILASDAINILAAVILFLLAIGNVRGFAFTLGLTTLVDLLVVWLFTHPIMTFMARTRFWGGGHKLSGFDPDSLGGVYRGRLQFRETRATGKHESRKRKGSRKEAERRLTIAERKAAQNEER